MLLDKISVGEDDHQKSIQLICADLAALSVEDAVDVLVISAFNNDYTPLPSTVIGGMYKKGLSVEELAKNKKVDLEINMDVGYRPILLPSNRTNFILSAYFVLNLIHSVINRTKL